MVFWQKYKDLEKLIKRTPRDKKRALLEDFSRPIQDETPFSKAKRVNTLIKLRAVMPLPGSGRRHTRVVGTVVQRHQKEMSCV